MTIKVQSLGISAVEEIRNDILSAAIAPGAKLTIKMLCERYDCGASPIREALNQLTSDGLVVRIDKRGFFVSETSEEEFSDILFNRCLLEGEALRRSIERGDGAWEERVVLTHFRLSNVGRETAGSQGKDISPAWEHAHKRFHMSLISACGSNILLRNCEKLYELNNRYRVLSVRKADHERDVATEHRAIFDFTMARDADKAVAELQAHYRTTGTFIFDQNQPSMKGATRKPRPRDQRLGESE